MANAQKTAFYEKYAPLAMEQQMKYGIPASVTLAQMYCESGGGMSKLAVRGNNYFGIKCSSDWLAAGKPYTLHSDDRSNEKFCSYDSVEESVQHHSKFLMGRRYANCRKCSSTDYMGWTTGLKAAGYATDKDYVRKILCEIKDYGLDKYDQQAVQMAQQQGITIGYAKGQNTEVSLEHSVNPSVTMATAGNYCFPVAGDNLVMSDGYEISSTSYRNHKHNGIDLRAKNQEVFATEDYGHVVATGYQSSGGNFVTVEYDRADGAKYSITYCHLDKINVKKHDTVNAGTVLGISGNTGNSTGPHLHLTVKHQSDEQSEMTTIDPLNYLAEISVRGNLSGTVLKKGTNEDLLASRKCSVDLTPTSGEVLLAQQTGNFLTPSQLQNIQQGGGHDPNNILAYLFGQNKDGQSQGGDLITSLVSSLFTSAISMAVMLDHSGNDEGVASVPAQQEETPEQRAATLIQRKRDSIDPEKAREMALMNFEKEYPEQQQGQGYRLA